MVGGNISNVSHPQLFRSACFYLMLIIFNQVWMAVKAVFYPQLDSEKDSEAEQVLQKAFLSHTIVGIPAREVLLAGGNLHCITQQIPV